MPNVCLKIFGAALVGVLLLCVSSPASAQKITLGVIAGASLTDDFRNTSITSGEGGFSFGDGATLHLTNASQWFMFGPTVDVAFSKRFSVEVDAIRRRIRSTSLMILGTPLELPNGTIIRQYDPGLGNNDTWQVSVLGKYKLSERHLQPFVESGLSFLPAENRDRTSITGGAGVELPLGRVRFTPRLRYTRWINQPGLGGVSDQFQFVVGVHEASTSQKPTLLGRPFSLGFVVGSGITKLLKDRSYPGSLSASSSDALTPIAGIRIGFPVTENLAVEVDGLFRGTHQLSGTLGPDGSFVKDEPKAMADGSRSAFLTWEFPVLAKYKLTVRRISPLFEVGPAFRITAHDYSPNHSHYGVSGGLGISTHLGKMKVSPTLRYTRWAQDKKIRGLESSTVTGPNQFEVVVGFSF